MCDIERVKDQVNKFTFPTEIRLWEKSQWFTTYKKKLNTGLLSIVKPQNHLGCLKESNENTLWYSSSLFVGRNSFMSSSLDKYAILLLRIIAASYIVFQISTFS